MQLMPNNKISFGLLVRWGCLTVAALVVLIVLWWAAGATWATRESAIAGTYSSQGAWGSSTLVMRPDHTFSQQVDFTNEYSGKSEGRKVVDRCLEVREA